MANILEFLRGVLTDDEAQRLFLADPEGYVSRSGFGDLTGEDVVEAIAVLRRSLLPDVASRLAAFEDERTLPPVRPSFDERELDAAVRQLRHAVELVGGAEPADEPTVEPAPPAAPAPPSPPPTSLFSPSQPEPVHHEPIVVEADPELAHPEAAQPAPVHHEPIPVEPEPALAAAAPSVPATPRPGGDALRARLASVADEVVEHLAEVIEDAERYADDLRAEAERSVQDLRAQAEADRDEARRVLLDAREEAHRIRAEAAEANAGLEARRDALREAEREVRERLAGLDSVFRSVLNED
jgi:hypothetical protein